MPELPEVETVVRGLQHLNGQKLINFTINDAKVWFESELPPAVLRGATLDRVERRGKYLLYRFTNCDLLQHLRMTGKMLSADSPVIPQNVREIKSKRVQIRCNFHFKNTLLSFYDARRFGTLTAVKNWEQFWRKKNLAPDPLLLPAEALAHFLQKISGRKKPVKNLLLDQAVILGVGNIYADEVLHRCKIHPKQLSHKVREETWREIVHNQVAIFQDAIKNKGTTVMNFVDAKGESGAYGELLRVYGREGKPCLKCKKSKIQKIVLAGRSSHFCPKCQVKK